MQRTLKDRILERKTEKAREGVHAESSEAVALQAYSAHSRINQVMINMLTW